MRNALMSCLFIVDRPLMPAFLALRRSSGTFQLAKEVAAPPRWPAFWREVLAPAFATRVDSLTDTPKLRRRF